MFDNTQTQTNIGNGKQVGRDDNSTTTIHQLNPIKHASNIERVLQGISSFITKTQPEKPDTDDYTIESKIDHNRLEKYKKFFDDYMDYYSVVREKISLFEEQDLAFEIKLISHIKNKYMLHFKPNQVSDDLVEKIILDIESELKNHSSLELEDISSIHYVVFYVFSRCKIFEKPPKVKS
jgi:hypothetical protein